MPKRLVLLPESEERELRDAIAQQLVAAGLKRDVIVRDAKTGKRGLGHRVAIDRAPGADGWSTWSTIVSSHSRFASTARTARQLT